MKNHLYSKLVSEILAAQEEQQEIEGKPLEGDCIYKSEYSDSTDIICYVSEDDPAMSYIALNKDTADIWKRMCTNIPGFVSWSL